MIMEPNRTRLCENCTHYLQWVEYGNVLGDCTNTEAFEFIRSLDGVEDPAASGCTYFVEIRRRIYD